MSLRNQHHASAANPVSLFVHLKARANSLFWQISAWCIFCPSLSFLPRILAILHELVLLKPAKLLEQHELEFRASMIAGGDGEPAPGQFSRLRRPERD
jgi:hypothetical protein